MYGPPALNLGKLAVQFPKTSETAVIVTELKVKVIFSFAAAFPHTGISISHCRTILSENIFATFNCPKQLLQ